MLRREKQLNTPLLAVGGFAVFADTDASMGLMLDNGFAFASVQVVDCLGKDTAFVQAAVIRGLDKAGMDVPDLVVDMVEPGVLAVVRTRPRVLTVCQTKFSYFPPLDFYFIFASS